MIQTEGDVSILCTHQFVNLFQIKFYQIYFTEEIDTDQCNLNYIFRLCSAHFRFLLVHKSDLYFCGKKNILPAFGHKP